jgi:hypothetical protein
MTRRLLVPAAAMMLLVSAPSSSEAQLAPDLAAAKTALARFADPIVAIQEGYFSTLSCVDFSSDVKSGDIVYPKGAMGVHFINTANIGPVLDPNKPQILLYEPVGDKLVLTGAEWFMPVEVAGGNAPSIFGKTLYGPMDGHEPIMPKEARHYDLHVWFYKDNPKGIFVSTNSAVKCPAGGSYTHDLAKHH